MRVAQWCIRRRYRDMEEYRAVGSTKRRNVVDFLMIDILVRLKMAPWP